MDLKNGYDRKVVLDGKPYWFRIGAIYVSVIISQNDKLRINKRDVGITDETRPHMVRALIGDEIKMFLESRR